MFQNTYFHPMCYAKFLLSAGQQASAD